MLRIKRLVRIRKLPHRSVISGAFVFTILLLPIAAHAQAGGTPFDTGFTALQTFFTGTIAKAASIIAIVIGGYQFAHGEPGAKKSRRAVFVSVHCAGRKECRF